MRRFLLPLTLALALSAVVGACADASAIDYIIDAEAGVARDGSTASDAMIAVSDAGATVVVSPLCKRTEEACDLDDLDACETPTPKDDAGTLADATATGRDAGSVDSDAAATAQEAGTAEPSGLRCSVDAKSTHCERAGRGEDGASCGQDRDCSSGFACARNATAPTKEGQCRRYCCSGTCGADASGKRFFCDVQPTFVDPVLAPVCMPLRPCHLLQAGACEGGETCAPVIQGASSCVAVGAATEGTECDDDHCAEGLVCLGAPGARKCKRLCHDGLRPCPNGSQCVGGYPYFEEDGYGVCTSPTAGK